MDALSSVLDLIRFEGWYFCQSELHAPWGIRLPGGRLAALHAVVVGRCEIVFPETSRVGSLGAGDLALLPLDRPHGVRSGPDAPLVSPSDLPGIDRRDRTATSLYLPGPGPACGLLTASFTTDGTFHHFALRGLPDVIVLRGLEGVFPPRLAITLNAVLQEGAGDDLGASPILRRLAEVLFVQCLRESVAMLPTQSAWLATLGDPVISRVLAAVHARPLDNWTLDQLAEIAHASRSVFAARFCSRMQTTPMAYVRALRLNLAASALQEGRASVTQAARIYGYASTSAFSQAFRRELGFTPAAGKQPARRTADPQ